MSGKTRIRRVGSIADELLIKCREAALAAVQVFNNPQISFKSEMFIVMMNIAWTYLMHSYYRRKGIEYRHFELVAGKRKFVRTKHGAFKHWQLEHCLNCSDSPIDAYTAKNLGFLIGIRHEIEHQMTLRLDSGLSAKFQACCLNINDYLKKLFGDKWGIDKHLSFSLQFSSISKDQLESLPKSGEMPAHISAFIEGFEGKLTEAEFNSPKFAYRVLFVAKTTQKKGQADEVIEFVRPESELASKVNVQYAMVKETEKPKLMAKRIVRTMQNEGFKRFKIHHHTELWQEKDAKSPEKHYGTLVEGYWYWYESWLEIVRQHCKSNSAKYE